MNRIVKAFVVLIMVVCVFAASAVAEVGDLEGMQVRDVAVLTESQMIATGTKSFGSTVQQAVRVYGTDGTTLWGHESDDESDMYAMAASAVLTQRFYDEIEPSWDLEAPFTVNGLLPGEKYHLAYGYVQGDSPYAGMVAFDSDGNILWKCVDDANTVFVSAAWTPDGSVALIGHASPNPQNIWDDYEFFAIYNDGERVSKVNYAPDTLNERRACYYTLAMIADGDGYCIVRKETMENDLQVQKLDAAGKKTTSWTEQTGAENNFYYAKLIQLGDAMYFTGAMKTSGTLLIHKLQKP